MRDSRTKLKIVLSVVIGTFLVCTVAEAGIKTIGRDETLAIDPAMIPPNYKAAFDIMKIRCIKCHTMERTVIAIQTGIAPISSGVFNKTATKAYGIKMMRKKDSNMSKSEVSEVVGLLNYLLDEAAR
jgi:uncharacterized membrane protein